jgi:hypothetical protein
MCPFRFVLFVGAACLVASCGAPEQPPPEKPRSVANLLEQAKRCEKEATAHEVMARAPEAATTTDACVSPIDDVSTSGGERLVQRRPCWTGLAPPSLRHEREAERLREEAAHHRAQAAALLRMEREACAGISQDEIDHSPFLHREDILRVEPYQVADELRGAKIWFRKVPGLTVDWMRRAVQCHQARGAVMGHTPSFQNYCPLVLEGVSTRVEDTPEGILLTIRAERDEVARAVLGRAQNACGPPLPTEGETTASTSPSAND